MKQGIIYGVTFLFVFLVVTGLLIYLNSSYENVFQFNFAPKSVAQSIDSVKAELSKVINPSESVSIVDTTTELKDTVLLSALSGPIIKDSIKTDNNLKSSKNNEDEKINPNKKNEIEEIKNISNEINLIDQPNVVHNTQKETQIEEYNAWVKKTTSIYASMEPKKAAKIIQTYSDNVARDILYNMNKKTAAKVVSELSPETANRIFRFE